MHTHKGIPCMTGIAVGEALVAPRDVEHRIHRRHVAPGDAAREEEQIRTALAKAAEEIDREIGQLGGYTGVASKILEFHKALILSPDLAQEISAHIRTEHMSAEFAVFTVMRRWHAHFAGLTSEAAAQKVHDLIDVERRIMRYIVGGTLWDLRGLDREVVLVAHMLTPSQAASLGKTKVKGFATDIGGKTAHTAIMARAMAIPAVVGTGDLSLRVQDGQTVIIDGLKGLVIVDPDADTLDRYREQERRHRAVFDALVAERDLPAETLDGYEVEVLANIELAEEAEMALAMGAHGVGLYRTEFLYEECHEPSEDMQCDVYQEVARRLGGRTCIIRTMDLGADKFAHEGQQEGERNPFLGSRSIRYSLQRPELFMVQLRAILRASVAGDVRLLFPMISVIEELREAKRHLARAKEELQARGIPFRAHIPVGMMVEVPSAALTVDQLAREVDFLSIGTNDLVQYALAVDRVNERVAHLYQPGSPAITRLLRHIIGVAQNLSIGVCVCGEMSADPRFVLLLLGLGLREYSVAPVAAPLVKHIVRSVSLAEAETFAEKTLGFATAEECDAFMSERLAALLPSLM